MADEIVSPARSLNALAENFLQEYVHQHPHTEFVRVCCQADRRCGIQANAVDVAAQACINEIQERIEITEAESAVVIRRACHRREVAFLAGTKCDKILWTHARHLAFVFTGEDAAKVSQALETQGVRVLMEPLMVASALKSDPILSAAHPSPRENDLAKLMDALIEHVDVGRNGLESEALRLGAEHGSRRQKQGYDAQMLVREFQLIDERICELMTSDKMPAAPVGLTGDLMKLTKGLNALMIAGLQPYVAKQASRVRASK